MRKQRKCAGCCKSGKLTRFKRAPFSHHPFPHLLSSANSITNNQQSSWDPLDNTIKLFPLKVILDASETSRRFYFLLKRLTWMETSSFWTTTTDVSLRRKRQGYLRFPLMWLGILILNEWRKIIKKKGEKGRSSTGWPVIVKKCGPTVVILIEALDNLLSSSSRAVCVCLHHHLSWHSVVVRLIPTNE